MSQSQPTNQQQSNNDPTDERPKFSVFPHQVAGHGNIVMIDTHKGVLFKPLINIELKFYWLMNKCNEFGELKPFLPKFFGVYNFEHNSATPTRLPPPQVSHLIINADVDVAVKKDGDTKEDTVRLSTTENVGKYDQKLQTVQQNQQVRHDHPLGLMIAIQDMVAGVEGACVLDMKMGIRHHTPDMSASKINMLIQRCLESTTATLGTRVSGMKVYNIITESFDFFDRKWGSELNDSTFQTGITRFFDNGKGVRFDVVSGLLSRLRDFRSIFQRTCFRKLKFISSSLLFVYDAKGKMYQLCMIDFAHVFTSFHLNKTTQPDSTVSTIDGSGQETIDDNTITVKPRVLDEEEATDYDLIHNGYLLGVDNLILTFERILSSPLNKSFQE